MSPPEVSEKLNWALSNIPTPWIERQRPPDVPSWMDKRARKKWKTWSWWDLWEVEESLLIPPGFSIQCPAPLAFCSLDNSERGCLQCKIKKIIIAFQISMRLLLLRFQPNGCLFDRICYVSFGLSFVVLIAVAGLLLAHLEITYIDANTPSIAVTPKINDSARTISIHNQLGERSQTNSELQSNVAQK